MSHHQTLMIVDVQNDFCSAGAVAVKDAEVIIPVINKYIAFFYAQGSDIIATRHWHPAKTSHFDSFGGEWPIHCIQETKGAQFHPSLLLSKDTLIISKGIKEHTEGYSAFEGVDNQDKKFAIVLKERRIKELFIAGLAVEYCVKETALDALQEGLKVTLLMDALKGVNVEPQAAEYALRKMVRKGAHKIVYEQLIAHKRQA